MASGTWNVDAAGNWSLATNWLSNVIADGAGSAANFSNNITAARTVTLDTTSRSIGAITLADSTSTFFGWTLANSGGAVLTLDDGAGGSPIITVNNAVSTISLPLAGTNGFTKLGTQGLTLNNASPATNTVSGTVIVSDGRLNLGTPAVGGNANQLPNVSEIVTNATGNFGLYFSYNTATGTIPNKLSGPGNVIIESRANMTGAGITVSGDLSSLGNAANLGVTGTGASTFAKTGLTLYTAVSTSAYTTTQTLPVQLSYVEDVGGSGYVQNLYYTGAGATYPTSIYLIKHTGQTLTRGLYANQPSGALVITGDVTSAGSGGGHTFVLAGTSTADNTMSGVFSTGTVAYGIEKAGTGKWVISGAGAHSGAWAVNGGTLDVTAAQTGTGTITVAPGATLTSSASIAKGVTVVSGGFATLNSNTGTLTLNGTGVTFGSGTSTTTGTHNIGNTAGVTTQLTIPAGRTITAASTSGGGVIIGSSSGSTTIVQDGGSVQSAASSGGAGTGLFFGSLSSGSSYNYFKGKGGSWSCPSFILYYGFSTASSRSGAPTICDFQGTTLTANTLGFGGSSSGNSVYTISSGAHTSTYVRLAWGAPSGSFVWSLLGPSTTLTSSSAFSLSDSATALNAQINIGNGAILESSSISVATATAIPFHLNGGTIRTSAASTGTGTVYLYGASNTISAFTGTAVFPYVIADSSGDGVSQINLATTGSGYIGAPYVTITGGGGTGATAKADWDESTGQLTGITITNPGTGYTSPPTVALSGGSPSIAATVVNPPTMAPNTSGSWTKGGNSTLSLSGNNTFVNAVSVIDGTLSIGNGLAAGTLGLNDASAVSIASGKTLNFNRSDARTYTGVISGEGNITKTTSGGTAILNADNTFTGTVTATSGALRAVRAQSFGAGSSSLTTASGGAIELDGGITVNRPVNLAGTGVSSTGALCNITGNNTISGTVAFTTGASIGSNQDTLTLSNPGIVSVAAGTLNFVGAGDVDFSPALALTTGGVTKSAGAGAAILRGTNTYTGVNTITAGRLGYVGSIAPSVAGNFGNASAADRILIAANAGIRYYGSSSATFSRNYTFQGGAGTINYLESNGAGAVTHTTAPTYATLSVAKTLGLGGTGTGANTIAYAILNNVGANAVGVTKADAGKWVLSQNNTATGAYAVNGGTLILQGTNTPSSVTVSNAGTVLGLDVATWSAGAKRTGTALVTVNANAKIQTFTGSGAAPQNGRHTYSNLTFLANGRIRIGGYATPGVLTVNGNMTINGATIWNFSDGGFQTAGTYRVVQFGTGASLVGGQTTLDTYVTPNVVVPAGRTVTSLTYTAASGSDPAYITLVLA